MISSDCRHDECTIMPVNGQFRIALHSRTALTLPAEKRRRPLWRVGLSVFFGLYLWLQPTSAHASVSTADVLQATNQQRQSASLPPLNHDQRLDVAAGLKADDMLAQQYFAHQSPTGQRGWDWMETTGYAYTEAGENLAQDFIDGRDIVTAWMGSTFHRKNLLSEKFTDMGIAAATGSYHGQTTTMVVQLFGRQTSPTAVMPAPVSGRPTTTLVTKTTAPVLATPIAAIKPAPDTIPSLVFPQGVTPAMLDFTYLTPAVASTPIISARVRPEVLGATTAIGAGFKAPIEPSVLGWLIFGALSLAVVALGLASRWWASIYPHPLKPLPVLNGLA